MSEMGNLAFTIEEENLREYSALPTLLEFHNNPGQIRCIVGPVGSGKTSGATQEICYELPKYCFEEFGMKHTRWVVVRNTYVELIDTTQKTIFDWFPFGQYLKQEKKYTIVWPEGFTVELLFRSCDRPEDVRKFKSLEITGYWIDESIEVKEEIKRMLKNRIGRYPRRSPVRFGIETTNPPDVEHPTYWQFAWKTPPPGPVPVKAPLPNHVGFWQPPYENVKNLRAGYYDDLRNDYRDNPDWIETYIEGKPGMIITGKLVYNNFKREAHAALQPLIWAKGKLFRGWDNSGNTPACVVVQMPRPRHIQVIREFHTEKMGIVDFGKYVTAECNQLWPGAEYVDWGDPAGENQYSKRAGGFTSNAQLMREECGIDVQPSEQNWIARKESVEGQLAIIDGMLIDPSCIRVLNGFISGYHYPELAGSPGRYAEMPEKNKYSHPHDALQYVMVKLVANNKASSGKSFTPRRSVPTVSSTMRRR